MTNKKHMSEHFRLVTPVNTLINTGLLGIVCFFLTQQYYRLDRVELKQNDQERAISDIQGYLRGYLHLSEMDSFNLTKIYLLSKEKPLITNGG